MTGEHHLAAFPSPQAGAPALLQRAAPPLVLASASPTRRALLAAAGLRFEAVATGVDEDAAKRQARALGATAADTAWRLATSKAQAVRHPDALVIGCDQILVCEGVWYDKPSDLGAARTQLLALRGRPHTLATATVVLCRGEEVWRHAAAPRLTMRAFSEAFLDAYLGAEGDRVLGSVGAYRLEGLGAQLFETVEGEHSAILGLPVVPLLGFLREVGVVMQ